MDQKKNYRIVHNNAHQKPTAQFNRTTTYQQSQIQQQPPQQVQRQPTFKENDFLKRPNEVEKLKKENDFLKSELVAAQEQIKFLMDEVKRLKQRQEIPQEVLMAMEMQRQMRQNQYWEFMQEAMTPQPQFETDNMTYEQILELQDKVGYVNRGLAKEQINSLKCRKSFQTIKEGCAICQSDINKFEEIIELRCRHQFHSVCIKQWLEQQKKCPICSMEQ